MNTKHDYEKVRESEQYVGGFHFAKRAYIEGAHFIAESLAGFKNLTMGRGVSPNMKEAIHGFGEILGASIAPTTPQGPHRNNVFGMNGKPRLTPG